ncbi:MAG: RNA 2',3'-cyclic phosphodiesterase [Acidobacteria bacterium]|jgi:2'-5' RNA ligase|nr:MAG: 2'-5' RNA ligase [Acidobacteriales bacterium 13_2_20CM_2_55_5]OLD17258.1 MAG: 2'-5' RNA ligase [Acidobacteriales bacterium 13_1_40CM_3_55_5]PYV98563.1 MAG: RNA 2',3'-cyclic phosphodiesterase [Acidobacteriota bacterium]PYX11425.1 MAG: RNA 2',3'-cyclic phosphodiesterase [Acidobacteriota bacterium]
MRIFVALDIDEAIRDHITRFMEGVRGFAPDARWVRPELLHVTLKFVGEKPPDFVEKIKQALSSVHAEAMDTSFRGYGFFPGPKAARVFWIGIEATPQLGTLAKAVDEILFGLGIPKEEHAFSPHLTLARAGGRSARGQKGHGPNVFQHLQEKLAALTIPDFGTVTSGEFFLYQSQPQRGVSRYTKIAAFPLQ